LGAEIPAYPAGDWGNYAKAAAQALVGRWSITRGMDAVVSGDLPMAAGLSSSSAMVVASALALLDANAMEVDRIELAELMAAAEHYVGTRGGGMDQAICLGGRRGHAALIEFAPLKLMPVAVPPDWRFLIAHSMVQASKSAGAREHYNQCVADCRAAAAVMGDFRALVAEPSEEEVLTRGQALLDDRLFRRFRHQITEGRRVYRACDAMTAGDAERFGALMLASHKSMRDDYLISCPEVDRLVEVAMDSGAIGARMTGAGFGGFVVALTDAARVDSLMGQMEERFYAPRGVSGLAAGHLLIVEPSEGAAVVSCS
jgi:galactokinase